MVEMPPDKRVVGVRREYLSKGSVYACLDVRRDVFILSQRMAHVQYAIQALCNQTPSMTSLFECVGHQRRSGRTAGAWSVVRLRRCDVPAFVDEHRHKYKRVMISSDNPRMWTLA